MKFLHSVIISLILLLSATTAHSATYYFHNDHLGTPQVLTDENQAVVWKGTYDPFGQVTETVATVEQNLRFPGQYLNRESGLHYNYFRAYDPSTGRYTQSDPIGLAGGISTYGYAYQSPTIFIDPQGLWANVAVGIGIRVFGGRAAGAAIHQGLKKSFGPVAGFTIACVLTGYCSTSEEGTESSENGVDSGSCPALPEGLVGDQSSPLAGQKGNRHSSGKLAPENGGTGNFEEDLGTLAGPVRPWQPGDSAPSGTLVGENGVFGRPGNGAKRPRIEIPKNGDKPHEGLHY